MYIGFTPVSRKQGARNVRKIGPMYVQRYLENSTRVTLSYEGGIVYSRSRYLSLSTDHTYSYRNRDSDPPCIPWKPPYRMFYDREIFCDTDNLVRLWCSPSTVYTASAAHTNTNPIARFFSKGS